MGDFHLSFCFSLVSNIQVIREWSFSPTEETRRVAGSNHSKDLEYQQFSATKILAFRMFWDEKWQR